MSVKTQGVLNNIVKLFLYFSFLERPSDYTITDVDTKINFTNSVGIGYFVPSTVDDSITVLATGYYEIDFSCSNIRGTADANIVFNILVDNVPFHSFSTDKPANQTVNIGYKTIRSLTTNEVVTITASYTLISGVNTEVIISDSKLILKKLT